MDSIAAKQFFISRVVEQAESDGLALSDIEKKMLHFTEAHPTLPDIYEVNAQFERTYDSDEYEAKIAGLLRKAKDRDTARSAVEAQTLERGHRSAQGRGPLHLGHGSSCNA